MEWPVDNGVVAHIQMCEGLYGQVDNLIKDMIVTSHYRAAFFAVKGMLIEDLALNPSHQ